MTQYNINDDFGGLLKIEPTDNEIYKDISIMEQDLEYLIHLLYETGDLGSPLYNYLLYQHLIDNDPSKITVTKKQTYLSAPMIQSMLVSLRRDVRNSESSIEIYLAELDYYYKEAKGKGTNTDSWFRGLNSYRTTLRKEHKHLANLVQQIKGLKAMLKDAV